MSERAAQRATKSRRSLQRRSSLFADANQKEDVDPSLGQKVKKNEQDKRLVKRNPKRHAPRHSANDAPILRLVPSQTPLRGDANRDEHNEQRLMVGSSQFRSVNQNRTNAVKNQHDPAITKFHSPRPPPKKPAAEQPKKW